MRRGIVILLLLASCGGESTPENGTFQSTTCWFDIPEGEEADCGTLTVAENRSDPESRSIQIAVAILRATTETPEPDPILYLEGGPGGSATPYADAWWEDSASFRQTRDFILVDQRGTGNSDPYLACDEVDDEEFAQLSESLTTEASNGRMLTAVQACHDRLVGEGVDLTAYHSAESASDLEELRQALGISSWNLYGISYGTRLALTIMRDHSAGLRSVILDSVYPPDAGGYLDLPAAFDRSLQYLFDACAADAGCAAAFPELETVFFRVLERIQEEPVTVTVPTWGGDDLSIVVTGNSLLGALLYGLSSVEVIPLLPAGIFEVDRGNNDPLELLAIVIANGLFSIDDGMYWSVECYEEGPFNSQEAVFAAADATPYLADWVRSDPIWSICDVWGAGTAGPVENNAVDSDIPTLLLAGSWDPLTPPSWAQGAAGHLSRGFYYEFPVGHGVSLSDSCARQVAIRFLDAPTEEPSLDCLNNLTGPTFELTWPEE